MMSDFLAGFAEADYTPRLGLALVGQMYTRVAESTRDPLMANAVAMRCGDETVVIVSTDMCFVDPDFVRTVRQDFADITGLPGERILLHTTHTHVAPTLLSGFFGEPDPEFVESLRESILKAAQSAIERLQPVTVFSGCAELDHLNWNRRSMYEDGTSAMHGSADKPGFIGTEGARDPNLSVIFFRDAEDKIIGVIPNFGTHPNCVEHGLHYSADLPGEVRRLLRSALGNDIGVVYLTGAAGNTTPIIREPGRTEQPWMGEEGLSRAGLYLAGEISKIIAQAIEPIESPTLTARHTSLHIPLRPYPAKDDICYPNAWSEDANWYFRTCEADWPRKLREESPVETRVSVVRIGDTVICTNPAELFSEFALRIRESSPARVTLISELTDGYCGYVPTKAAFARGGYETWTCATSKLSQDAGEMIVDATNDMLRQ